MRLPGKTALNICWRIQNCVNSVPSIYLESMQLSVGTRLASKDSAGVLIIRRGKLCERNAVDADECVDGTKNAD